MWEKAGEQVHVQTMNPDELTLAAARFLTDGGALRAQAAEVDMVRVARSDAGITMSYTLPYLIIWAALLATTQFMTIVSGRVPVVMLGLSVISTGLNFGMNGTVVWKYRKLRKEQVTMVETSHGGDGDLEVQLLALGNEVLHVRPKATNLLEFKSNSESKWILGKVKASFEGVAKLDPAKREVTYKDKVTKTSFGMGGEDAGFSKESFVIKGIERSGSGAGFVPTGNTYNYDFGKVREMVKGVVERNGWKFKVSLFFMPK